MQEIINKVRMEFYRDFTQASLKWAIRLWAVLVIVLTFFVNNKWVLAGILAYEVLP